MPPARDPGRQPFPRVGGGRDRPAAARSRSVSRRPFETGANDCREVGEEPRQPTASVSRSRLQQPAAGTPRSALRRASSVRGRGSGGGGRAVFKKTTARSLRPDRAALGRMPRSGVGHEDEENVGRPPTRRSTTNTWDTGRGPVEAPSDSERAERPCSVPDENLWGPRSTGTAPDRSWNGPVRGQFEGRWVPDGAQMGPRWGPDRGQMGAAPPPARIWSPTTRPDRRESMDCHPGRRPRQYAA